MIINAIGEALSNMDWRYTTPSRIDYGGVTPDFQIIEQVWQERLFAYELYHQLRLIWDANPDLAKGCVIHAEVRKGYQHIPNMDKMPDLLFHYPERNNNFGVLEIKLAKHGQEEIETDLNKLSEFQLELGYSILIQILIGSDVELRNIKGLISRPAGTEIHLFCVSTDTHLPTYEIIKYALRNQVN